ncbi:hypothetical protein CVT24_010302 [Panaeolus cyanescens]|uniref:Gfo/Idh/MocA-like oxidoreductase N-terminal domain-containing protein n=1 Tax=Panaeolus cyanescens TaxID=181874 RepID=A0A409YQD1_9AGAR|nr:hypothetical protein CVT24_010302 [Panaeolus cyanescens]
MSSAPIKVGFVGLSANGWAATSLGPALLDPSLKGVYELKAVSTSNADSAAASAAKHSDLTGSSVKPYHGSTSAIAEDENVDLVAISVKAPLHRDAVLPVIQKGKNFFLEWPAGKSLQETEEIRAAAQKKGVKTFIGLQARVSPVVQKVKQLIDSDAIGKVQSSTFVAVVPSDIHMWSPTPNGSGHNRYALDASNAVTPLTVGVGHLLDPIIYTLGHLTTITAVSSQVHPILKLTDADGKETSETLQSQFDEHFTFGGQFPNGAHSSFTLRFGGKFFPGRKTVRWEIEGEKGHILLESENIFGAFINVTSPRLFLNGEEVAVLGVQSGASEAVGILVDQWKEYAKGEQEGKYATIDDAVILRRTLDAIAQSAREGKRVELDLKL